MSRKHTFAPDEYYHIFNSGVDKRDTFLSPGDKERFLALLYVCNSKRPVRLQKHLDQGIPLTGMFSFEQGERLVDIVAYSLMPNRFHMLVRERVDGGVVILMRKILTAYTMYFNKKYARRGVLFQGAFKSEHIDSDRHLRYLFSYIHFAPVDIIMPDWRLNHSQSDKLRIKAHLSTFPFSSLPDYIGTSHRPQSVIICRDAFSHKCPKRGNLEDYIDDFIKREKEHEEYIGG